MDEVELAVVVTEALLESLPPSKECLLKRSVADSPLRTLPPPPPTGDTVTGRGTLEEESSEEFCAAAAAAAAAPEVPEQPPPLNVE